MSHSRCFWWQVTEKVSSVGLTTKQNALTHTTGSPEKGHNIVSSKAQLFSPVSCSILIILLTLLMIKIWLQWPWALHPHLATSRGRKELYLFYVSPFQDPFFVFLFKNEESFPKISPIPIGLLSSLNFLCPFLSQGLARWLLDWLDWFWSWSPGILEANGWWGTGQKPWLLTKKGVAVINTVLRIPGGFWVVVQYDHICIVKRWNW